MIGFKSVCLLKDQTLGIGSYGAVCKAKCDDLVCAAKIIHPTLFDPLAQPPQGQHRQPMRRFEQECEFLSSMRHPNIVLYLGMHHDKENGLPVLLMELMDNSLTNFIESSSQSLPYNTAVTICHDITLALSFLHSNKIVHRDLSSNNILLRGNVLAKVTDFGMARLREKTHGATYLTNTICPGSDAYMPPEAVDEIAAFTEKIDCFSFGVIVLQMLTRLFPKPGNRVETINDPRYPRTIKMNVPEVKRREEHISIIDPNQPLLRVVLDCLRDEEKERPSAEQLSERMAALKESGKYTDAVERGQAGSNKQVQEAVLAQQEQLEVKRISTVECELRECQEENQRLKQENEHISEDKQRLERDKAQIIHENNLREEQFKCVNSQLIESQKMVADLKERVTELQKQLGEKDPSQKCSCDKERSDTDGKKGCKWTVTVTL